MIINLANTVYMARTANNTFEPQIINLDNSLYPRYIRYAADSKFVSKNDCFIISIDNPNAINYINLKVIMGDSLYLSLIDKKINLLIEYSTDASYSVINNIYETLVKAQNVPAKHILLVGGSKDYIPYIQKVSADYNSDPIHLEIFYRWEEENLHRFYNQFNINVTKETPYPKIENPFVNKNFVKKFLNFNGMYRSHRYTMTALLYNNDLIKHGFISFAKFDDEKWNNTLQTSLQDFPKLSDEIHKGSAIKQQLPLVLDLKDLFNLDLAMVIRSSMSYYRKSYFSLISETNFKNKYPRFVTEKIIKGFMFKHPFIPVTTPGILSMLKDMGYKTFDSIIDESYDIIVDNESRLEAILKEVKRLCNLNSAELDEFCKIAYNITEYNYNVLSSKRTFIVNLE